MTTARPKISIITAVYNGAAALPAYFASLFNQTYPNFELIVVDGGSEDGSVELIRQHQDRLHYWHSEPDQGIYDAWNKGLGQAGGDWIAFLGADDHPAGPETLARLAQAAAAAPDALFISGRARMWDANGQLIRVRGAAWRWPNFKWRLRESIIHQGALHHRRLFERYGQFDTRYRIAGDYELLLRPGPALAGAFVAETLFDCGYGLSSRHAFAAAREVLTIHRRSRHVNNAEALLAFAAGLTRFYGGRLRHRRPRPATVSA